MVEKITPLGAIAGLIVLILLWLNGAFDGLDDIGRDNAENLLDAGENLAEQTPQLLEAGNLWCNYEEILTDKILTTGIYEQMLLNTDGQVNDILGKWAISGRVDSCEVVILNEIMEYEGLHKTYRNQIGLKNAVNEQFCVALQCIKEYGVEDYLKKYYDSP